MQLPTDPLRPYYDVALSFAGPDRDKAAEVARILKECGTRVFFDKDEDDLLWGEDGTEVLMDIFTNRARFVVVFVSKEYVERKWTRLELRAVRDRALQREVYILPIKVEPNVQLPGVPSTVLYLDWAEKGGDGIAKVVRAKLGQQVPTAISKSPDAIVRELTELLLSGSRLQRTNQLDTTSTARVQELAGIINQAVAPRAGAIIANAELVRPIGFGAFAAVWLARDLGAGDLCAVKILRQEKLTGGLMFWRFQRGIAAQERLGKAKDRGEHIVALRSISDYWAAFSMDYHAGGNLENIDKYGWTLDKKIGFFSKVCLAVDIAHRHGIIHRDIKPSNILLHEKGDPVLTDFDAADIRFATQTSISEGGLGTPIFAAPEQLEDETRATERSDVYSLGRLLHFMLLERSPGFQLQQDPDLENLSDFSPGLVAVVRRATQWSPQLRFQSALELVSAVELCGSRSATIAARVDILNRGLRRHLGIFLATAIMMVGLAAFAVYQGNVAQRESASRREAEELQLRNAIQFAKVHSLETEKSTFIKEMSLLLGLMSEIIARGSLTPSDKDQLSAIRRKFASAEKDLVDIDEKIRQIMEQAPKPVTVPSRRKPPLDGLLQRYPAKKQVSDNPLEGL